MSTIKELAILIESLKQDIAEMKVDLNTLGKNQNNTDKNNLEAIGAKIIKDLSDKIDKCECTDKLYDKLNQETTDPPRPVIPHGDQTPPSSQLTKYTRYSWPNERVGNPELGSSGAPNPVQWPPKA